MTWKSSLKYSPKNIIEEEVFLKNQVRTVNLVQKKLFLTLPCNFLSLPLFSFLYIVILKDKLIMDPSVKSQKKL